MAEPVNSSMLDQAVGEFIDLGSTSPLEGYHEDRTLKDPLTMGDNRSWHRGREGRLQQPWVKSETVMGHADDDLCFDFEATLESVENEELGQKIDILCPTSTEVLTVNKQQQQLKNSWHMKGPNCFSSLEQTWNGQLKIATILLTRVKKFPCKICGKNFAQKSSLNLHIESHVDERPSFTCDECGTINKSKVHLRKHLKTMHCRTDYACEICGKSFTHQSSLKTHSKTHTLRPTSFSCKICDREFDREIYLKRHEIIHTNEKLFSCETCGKRFRRQSAWASHNVIHTVEGNLCKICNTEFEGQGALRNHFRLMHINHDFAKCKICGKSFKRRNILKIHMGRDHGYKSFVCEFCNKTFSLESKLKKHSVKHLSDMPHSCETCGRKFSKEKNLKLHMRVHETRLLFSCNVCTSSFAQKTSLNAHMKTHTDKKPPFICDNCGKSFDLKYALRKHMRNVHSGTEHFCKMCGKNFTRKCSLDVHMETHLDERPSFTCDKCGSVSTSKSSLRKHLRKMHGGTQYPCETCGKSFGHQRSLKIHTKTHTQGSPSYCCKICNKSFYKKILLKNHEIIHSNERPFSCETCGKQCRRQSDLVKHYVAHAVQGNCCKICNTNFESQEASKNHVRMMHKTTDLKKFIIGGEMCVNSESTGKTHQSNDDDHNESLVCEFCGKMFSFASQLKKHLISHSSEKPHSCEICGKMFSRQKLLKAHMKVGHTNRELFSCEICDKSLRTESSLKAHMDLHMEKKPFSCQVCGDSFADRGSLRGHSARHTGTEPYPCNICGKKYTVKRKFEDHQRTHTGEKPFQCHICGKCFGYENSRTNHLKTHTERIECKVCNRRYKTEEIFARHKLKCKSENRFKCDICHHTSSSRATLWRHKLTHKPKKCLNCHFCGAVFHMKSQLRCHMALHTGYWLFPCTICDKKFQQKFLFKAHMKKYHEDKETFTCDICQRGFSAKKILEVHIRMHRGGDDSEQELRVATATTQCKMPVDSKFDSAGIKSTENEYPGIGCSPEFPLSEHSVSEPQMSAVAMHFKEKLVGLKLGIAVIEAAKMDLTKGESEYSGAKFQLQEFLEPPTPKETYEGQHYTQGLIPEDELCVYNHRESLQLRSASKTIMDYAEDELSIDFKAVLEDTNDPEKGWMDQKNNIECLTSMNSTTEDEQHRQLQSFMHPKCTDHHSDVNQIHGYQRYLTNRDGIMTRSGKIYSEESTTQIELGVHKEIFHVPESSTCDTCGMEFSRGRQMPSYESQHLNGKRLVQCDDCDQSFKHESNVAKRPTGGKGERPFPCKICDKTYTRSDNLERQMKLHNVNPTFSSDVCENICEEQVNPIADIRTTAMPRTEEKYEMCDSSFTQRSSLNAHKKFHSNAKIFTCKVYSKSFKSQLGLKMHTRKMHEISDPFSCDICGRNFGRKHNLLSHLKAHESTKTEKTCTCKICGKTFRSKSNLSRHALIHTNEKPFSCENCEKRFKSTGDLKNHITVVHVNTESLTCDICNQVFNRKATMIDHYKMTHLIGSYVLCEVCGKVCASKATLERHFTTHTTEKPYSCDICNKNFNTKMFVKGHIQAVHVSRTRFPCEICGKSLRTESSLKAHMDLHMGKKQFSCQICGDSFAYKSGLQRHSKKHSGTEPYPCNICGKKYTVKRKFEDHQRTHTGEKPFQCHICGKCFGYENSRINHLKTHTDRIECKVCNRRFQIGKIFDKHKLKCKSKNRLQCGICHKTLSSRVTMWSHKLTHRTEKRLKCDHCGAGFHTMRVLKLHILRHMNEWPFSCEICGAKFRTKQRFTHHIKKHSSKESFTCDICQEKFNSKKLLKVHFQMHTGEEPDSR
ncbi:hypothetical protein QAD02_006677 [Eretmocerus hayati]|uniref:Uncharacterized protein n=1 Tax=Eretmocerus hayati TaxID=131215 RepID=A0ACC2N1H9_9HYME|nr:hypothetical protein QAD02_006677 [Eretmocerus hayati]